MTEYNLSNNYPLIGHYYKKYPELIEFFSNCFHQLELSVEDDCIDGYRMIALDDISNPELKQLYDDSYTCCGEAEKVYYHKETGKGFKFGLNYGH